MALRQKTIDGLDKLAEAILIDAPASANISPAATTNNAPTTSRRWSTGLDVTVVVSSLATTDRGSL